MKFNDMQKGIVYEVTSDSSDGTFQRGDLISLFHSDGSIICWNGGGWLDYEDFKDNTNITDFEVKVSPTYYTRSVNGSSIIEKIPTMNDVPWRQQLIAASSESVLDRDHPIIYAVDFDDTLCNTVWPGTGEPNVPLVEFLRKEHDKGNKIILWTCRCGHLLDNAVQWCKDNDIPIDAVNENIPEVKESWGVDSRKVHAHFYIDDKAVFLKCSAEDM